MIVVTTLSINAGCLRMINVKTVFHTWKPLARYQLSGEIHCVTCLKNITIQSSLRKDLLFNLSNILMLIREEPTLCSVADVVKTSIWEKFKFKDFSNFKLVNSTAWIRYCLGLTSQYSEVRLPYFLVNLIFILQCNVISDPYILLLFSFTIQN